MSREGTPATCSAQHGGGDSGARILGWLASARFGQFARFVSVGAVSTLSDWTVFYVTAVRLGLHYQAGVACSWVLATVVHYALNKLFTFRCKSPRILRQLALHACMSAIYLLLSMASMYALVDLVRLPPMAGKILTTGAMTVVSFTLARMVTFNPDLLR